MEIWWFWQVIFGWKIVAVCRFCAVKQIRRDQCFCPICGKDFGLEESEAIVRDSVLQKKFQQYAPDGYFFKVNFDEEARKKRVPSSYEVVVLRDNVSNHDNVIKNRFWKLAFKLATNTQLLLFLEQKDNFMVFQNLSSLVSSLCAPYEKISFCLEYRALEVLAYPAIRSECEPSTSYSSVKLQRSSARISVKREPEYRSTGSVEDSVFFRRYFLWFFFLVTLSFVLLVFIFASLAFHIR